MSEISYSSDKVVDSPFIEYIDNLLPKLHDLVDNFQAGRFCKFIDFWKTLTFDKEILQTVT